MNKEELIEILNKISYKVFDDKLNIVGVRNSFILDNKFSDDLYVWSNTVPFRKYTITTKPGKYWWQNFTRTEGVAILVENQYEDSWQLGLHNGKYEALVQTKPIFVYRDDNKDTSVDMKKTEKGIFGINIHRASANYILKTIERYSAGCQVFVNIKEFNEFIQICKDSKQKDFTYSLINQKIINKFKKQ
jgi:hypothetical protein